MELKLVDGSRVGVIGGGPAGAFVSYFLLEMAARVDLDIAVDLYEPKDFSVAGPGGCNNCGGIISESLVQMLATEGINLPPTVVQRGIDAYVLHSDVGTVRIESAVDEKRIAAVHRGSGPRGTTTEHWDSFDGFLLKLAHEKGANVIRGRVDNVTREDDKPVIHLKGGEPRSYDLVVGAVGVNSPLLKVFERLGFNYRPPRTVKTYVAEFRLGVEEVTRHLGNSMHMFLLDIPRLEFAAFIPKGECVTLCLLGHEIDKPLVDQFLSRPEVLACFPPGRDGVAPICHCSPRINVGTAVQPFADRVVLIGDSAVTRLYKDGIGAAYRTAKATALTAVLHGVSARDFRRHYWPVCQRLERDNKFGAAVFMIVGLIRKLRFSRQGVVKMVRKEQGWDPESRVMSMLLWDTFTGSGSYRGIFRQGLGPGFLARLARESSAALLPSVVKPET